MELRAAQAGDVSAIVAMDPGRLGTAGQIQERHCLVAVEWGEITGFLVLRPGRFYGRGFIACTALTIRSHGTLSKKILNMKVNDPVLLPAPQAAFRLRVQRAAQWPVPVGVLMEDRLLRASSASAATVCATRSATVGTPRVLVPPPLLGISTAITGGGK